MNNIELNEKTCGCDNCACEGCDCADCKCNPCDCGSGCGCEE
jgi:hypothetical protein